MSLGCVKPRTFVPTPLMNSKHAEGCVSLQVFCRTCGSTSGPVGSPSFCSCAHLPPHNTKHRMLTPGFRLQLASGHLVSPGSCGELILAYIPLTMTSTLEPESAFPAKHHHILSFMLLYFTACISLYMKHCFRLGVLFQSVMV